MIDSGAVKRLVHTIILAVSLHATFDTSTSAVISWQQPAGIYETCLHRYYGATDPAAICWRNLEAGEQVVRLPGIYDRRFYWPAHGDVYVLSFNGEVVGRTVLGEVPSTYTTYLPHMQTTGQSAPPKVYVPTVLR